MAYAYSLDEDIEVDELAVSPVSHFDRQVSKTPWYRHPTLIAVLKSVAINFLLPFVNGIMLGFGEICANELVFRYGWFGTSVYQGSTANLGLRTATDGYRRMKLGESKSVTRQLGENDATEVDATS
ncbi:hypothetical protein BZG36_05311 [Bifiguratus adelaidae]|uniref:Mitochondrial import protein 1 n=1 Tax=Bifiguratus adelaidae TaxID=1938954 RepID=A0A261XTZ3_9FUNG|nr:hypothetical protein BZG36_05311 [Bifiguratus adelaidae]